VEKIHPFLLGLNGFAVGSAFIFEPGKQSIISVMGHQIHAGSVEFRVQQLSLMALLQLTHAESSASALAAVAEGETAIDTAFPLRQEPNEILTLPFELIQREMESPSKFTDQDELQSIFAMISGSPYASDGWWDGGISIEVPFGPHDTALIELRNDVKHPSLGSGLAVRTTLRTEFMQIDPIVLAVELQQRQLNTVSGGGQMGAWGIRSDLPFSHVAWSRFIPNVLFKPQLMTDVVFGEINRALWCDEILFPGLFARNARDLMIARDKLRAEASKGLAS
jgi:hypothetical protein